MDRGTGCVWAGMPAGGHFHSCVLSVCPDEPPDQPAAPAEVLGGCPKPAAEAAPPRLRPAICWFTCKHRKAPSLQSSFLQPPLHTVHGQPVSPEAAFTWSWHSQNQKCNNRSKYFSSMWKAIRALGWKQTTTQCFLLASFPSTCSWPSSNLKSVYIYSISGLNFSSAKVKKVTKPQVRTVPRQSLNSYLDTLLQLSTILE